MTDFNNTINDPILASSPNVQNVKIVSSDVSFGGGTNTGTTSVSGLTFTDGSQKTQLVNGINKPDCKPDYWDTTSIPSIVFEGYKTSMNLILSKIDLTGGTRTWGTDLWANRLVAIYS